MRGKKREKGNAGLVWGYLFSGCKKENMIKREGRKTKTSVQRGPGDDLWSPRKREDSRAVGECASVMTVICLWEYWRSKFNQGDKLWVEREGCNVIMRISLREDCLKIVKERMHY